MRTCRTMLLLGSMLVLLMPAVLARAETSAEPKPERLVEVDFRDSSFDLALNSVFKDTPYSFVLAPGSTNLPKITLQLHSLPFSQAISLIGKAAGMTYDREGDVFYFIPVQPTVTLNGQQVPILGAMQLGPNGQIATPYTLSAGPAAPPARNPQPTLNRPSRGVTIYSGPDDPLVSLSVDNVPLRDAIAKLSAAAHQDLRVYPEVPESLRVTAHVYLMPFAQFLSQLLTQSDLTVAYDYTDASGKVVIPQGPADVKQRFYVIPYSSIRLWDQAKGVLLDKSDCADQSAEGVDLTVTDVPFREAIAKLATAWGKDIVVNEAVPNTLRVTAKVYRLGGNYLLDTLVQSAGLEERQVPVSPEGVVRPRSEPRSPSDHIRYYIVPKSELKVSGLPASAVSDQALALANPGLSWRLAPSAPMQLDPNGGALGLLKNSQTTVGTVAR